MDNNSGPTPGTPFDGDEISLVAVANTILRNWRVLAVLPALLALVVGLWSLSQDRMYRASASFFPQSSEGRGGGGGAAALAQQFGVSLALDRPTQSPQFYADLLRSRALLRAAVEAEYRLTGTDGTAATATLVDLFESHERADAVPPWLSALDELRKRVSVSVVRETGVVQLVVTASQPALAEQIAERLLELLNAFNIDVRRSHAQEEHRFIAARLEEVQAELAVAETALQGFLRQNREFRNSPELSFEHERLQRRVAMRQEVYTSLLRSQEQTRIDGVRDTPFVTVIDAPTGSAEPIGRGTMFRVTLAFLVGLIISIGVSFVIEFVRRGRELEDPHYREFQGLARQAWIDLRRPRRWFRRGHDRVAAGGS